MENRKMKNKEELRTVLLIDDDEGILDVTSRMIEKLGYHVLAAETGDEAVKIADKYDGTILAALMDICLPGIQGKELYLRLMESRSEMQIVVCSGYTHEGLINEMIAMGAAGYMQKPVTLAMLSSILRNITDRRKHKRFVPHQDAFAVIESWFSGSCKIHDISMGGLSFFSEHPIGQSNGNRKILLDIRDKGFTLDRIPCSLISNGNQKMPSGNEQAKRFSLEFSKLNSEQRMVLTSLLESHTI
jgi:DNA-binding response OmpR family regulator